MVIAVRNHFGSTSAVCGATSEENRSWTSSLTSWWMRRRLRSTVVLPSRKKSSRPRNGMRYTSNSQAIAEDGRRFCGMNPRAATFTPRSMSTARTVIHTGELGLVTADANSPVIDSPLVSRQRPDHIHRSPPRKWSPPHSHSKGRLDASRVDRSPECLVVPFILVGIVGGELSHRLLEPLVGDEIGGDGD